jgi:hypothetical protein
MGTMLEKKSFLMFQCRNPYKYLSQLVKLPSQHWQMWMSVGSEMFTIPDMCCGKSTVSFFVIQ